MVVARPVPEREIVVGEFVALLVMVSKPDAAPVPAGANFKVYCAFPFGVRIFGYDGWDTMLKPAPVIDAAPIATLAVPVFVMVAVSVAPLPKARFVGLAASVIVGPPGKYSYAPISKAAPCGRATPSKSVASPAMVAPALMAGLAFCKWKSGLLMDSLVNLGSTLSEAWMFGLAGGAPLP